MLTFGYAFEPLTPGERSSTPPPPSSSSLTRTQPSKKSSHTTHPPRGGALEGHRHGRTTRHQRAGLRPLHRITLQRAYLNTYLSPPPAPYPHAPSPTTPPIKYKDGSNRAKPTRSKRKKRVRGRRHEANTPVTLSARMHAAAADPSGGGSGTVLPSLSGPLTRMGIPTSYGGLSLLPASHLSHRAGTLPPSCLLAMRP